MFHTLHCVLTGPDKWYPFKRVIHVRSIHLGRFDCTPPPIGVQSIATSVSVCLSWRKLSILLSMKFFYFLMLPLWTITQNEGTVCITFCHWWNFSCLSSTLLLLFARRLRPTWLFLFANFSFLHLIICPPGCRADLSSATVSLLFYL